MPTQSRRLGRCQRVAASSSVIGSASVNTGCTTASEPACNALAWNPNPTSSTTPPSSHKGDPTRRLVNRRPRAPPARHNQPRRGPHGTLLQHRSTSEQHRRDQRQHNSEHPSTISRHPRGVRRAGLPVTVGCHGRPLRLGRQPCACVSRDKAGRTTRRRRGVEGIPRRRLGAAQEGVCLPARTWGY